MQKLYYPFFIFVLMLISLQGYGQGGTWTWISGDSTLNSPGNFGTKGVASDTSVPPGLNGSQCWTDRNENFWLFSGTGSLGFYNDLWKYDPSTHMWTWISGAGTWDILGTGTYGTKGVAAPGNYPGVREGATTWTDNNGDLWMFGGYGNGISPLFDVKPLNDLWKYNIANNEWTWMNGADTAYAPAVWGTQGVPDSLNTPGNRAGALAHWVDNNNGLWLMGGINWQLGTYNDLWKFDTHINEWIWMKGADSANLYANYGNQGVPASTNVPASGGTGCSWTDAHGNFWLFGGEYYLGPDFQSSDDNTLWKYDTGTNEWTWIDGPPDVEDSGSYGPLCHDSTGYLPSARYTGLNWTDDYGNFWLYGSSSTSNYVSLNFPDDMWYFNPDSLTWNRVYGQVDTALEFPVYGQKGVPDITNNAGTRYTGVHWRDKNGNLYVWGGAANYTNAASNDMWVYVPDTACIHAPTVNTSVVTATTALREQQINIFPNPTATGDFHLSISADLIGSEVDIFNMNGEVVYRSVVHSPGSEISLNVAAGVYTVRVVSANTSITKKLIRL